MFGIDVSSNNGSINWGTVAQNPVKVDFAFIKATEGVGYSDPLFVTNAQAAKAAGIRVGYYHYATLNKTDNIADAKSEADYFASIVRKAPGADLPLILDVETNKVLLGKAQVQGWIQTFFAELAANGFPNTALYSYTPFLDANLPANHKFGDVKLWIAAYVNVAKPKLPNGWSSYWIWQYSDKGKISGISGNVDLNKTIDPI